MEFGEIIFYILIGLIVLYFIISSFEKSEEEKEYDRKLKESLADEFIYDPETGTKLTLEQAESGHWIPHDNPNRVKSKEEIEANYSGREIEAQEVINLMKSNGYNYRKLTIDQIDFLERSKILSKYDDWSYSDSFSFNDGENFIFFPAVQFTHRRYLEGYHESQLMFWIKNDNLSGHIYLRDKTSFEAFTDLIRNDDEIKLDNYETFVFRKSANLILLLKTLSCFEAESELEIEVIDNNLLVKTLRFANMEDFLRVEQIIKKIV